MTEEIRFQTGFSGAATGEPGLVRHPDGTVWLVNPDGSETQLPGGGGSSSEFDVVDDGVTRGKLYYDSDDGQLRLDFLDSDGVTLIARLGLGVTGLITAPASNGEIGFDLDGAGGPGGHARLLNGFTGGLGSAWVLDSGPIGDAGQFAFIYGSVDPTEDGGLDFGAGTLYAVTSDMDGTASLWYQVSSGPPVWQNISGGSVPYLTVQSGVPGADFVTPLVQDTTAVTGGAYAWDGSAYQKISGPVS